MSVGQAIEKSYCIDNYKQYKNFHTFGAFTIILLFAAWGDSFQIHHLWHLLLASLCSIWKARIQSALTWVESPIKIAIFEVQRANNKTWLRLRMKIFFLFVLTNRAHKSVVFLSLGLGPLLQSWKTQRHPTIESTKGNPHSENGSSSSLCRFVSERHHLPSLEIICHH